MKANILTPSYPLVRQDVLNIFTRASRSWKYKKSCLTREINSILNVKQWIIISLIYNYHPIAVWYYIYTVQSTPSIMNFSRTETSKVQYKLYPNQHVQFKGPYSLCNTRLVQETIKSFQYKQSRLQDKCSRDYMYIWTFCKVVRLTSYKMYNHIVPNNNSVNWKTVCLPFYIKNNIN